MGLTHRSLPRSSTGRRLGCLAAPCADVAGEICAAASPDTRQHEQQLIAGIHPVHSCSYGVGLNLDNPAVIHPGLPKSQGGLDSRGIMADTRGIQPDNSHGTRVPICERISVSMNRATTLSRAARAVLAEHFELFMTIAGVLIAIMIILSELSQGEQGTALIFLVWLQGLILWAVHRHCMLRSRAMVDRLRMMVQDRVNNRLTLWLSLTDVQSRVATEAGRDEREAVSLAAARAVSLELEKVSLDSLRTWERRYSRFITSWGQ